MNTNHSGVARSLGVVGLGLLAMLAAGCADTPADDPASQPDENTETAEAKIVGVAPWGINGCSGAGMYDVASNQNINFIAIDSSDFQNLNSSLSQVDAAGNQTAINQSMVAADESFQSMINSFTNFINAAQQSSLIASQQSATTGRWATTEAQEASTVQTVTNSSARGTQNTVTENLAQHDNRSLANASNFATQSGFASRAGVAGVGPWLGGVGGVGSTFFNNNNVAANTNSLLSNSIRDYNRTAVHSDFATAAHNDSLVASSSLVRTALADTTALTNFASQQSNLASLNQATSQSMANQATRASSQASTYVFNNLNTYQMNRAVLNVQAIARQSNQILRVFAGNQFGVTGWSEFNLGFPACGAGVGVVAPVVAAPVVPVVAF